MRTLTITHWSLSFMMLLGLCTAQAATVTCTPRKPKAGVKKLTIYAFNAYPRPNVEITNLFKLFKGLPQGRLTDAGVNMVGGKPTLCALGSSTQEHRLASWQFVS